MPLVHRPEISDRLHRVIATGALLIGAVVLATGCGGDAVTQTDRVVVPTAIPAPDGAGSDGSPLTLEVVDGGPATGLVLTDFQGMALYGHKNETPEALLCDPECAKVWVPLSPRDGGVSDELDASLYRVITRADGSQQAVYNDIALYRWTGDSQVGITQGAGVAGVWFAMTSTGNFSKPDI